MGVQVGAWCLQGLDGVAEVCPWRGKLAVPSGIQEFSEMFVPPPHLKWVGG